MQYILVSYQYRYCDDHPLPTVINCISNNIEEIEDYVKLNFNNIEYIKNCYKSNIDQESLYFWVLEIPEGYEPFETNSVKYRYNKKLNID